MMIAALLGYLPTFIFLLIAWYSRPMSGFCYEDIGKYGDFTPAKIEADDLYKELKKNATRAGLEFNGTKVADCENTTLPLTLIWYFVGFIITGIFSPYQVRIVFFLCFRLLCTLSFIIVESKLDLLTNQSE